MAAPRCPGGTSGSASASASPRCGGLAARAAEPRVTHPGQGSVIGTLDSALDPTGAHCLAVAACLATLAIAEPWRTMARRGRECGQDVATVAAEHGRQAPAAEAQGAFSTNEVLLSGPMNGRRLWSGTVWRGGARASRGVGVWATTRRQHSDTRTTQLPCSGCREDSGLGGGRVIACRFNRSRWWGGPPCRWSGRPWSWGAPGGGGGGRQACS